MKLPVRRPYRQKKRAASAATTRARIVRAARALFERKGLFEVGIDDVAAKAGVSRATVFQIFGSKAGLVDAIAVSTLESAEFRALLAALATRDPVRALRNTVDTGCRYWARIARLARAMSLLASTDQDVARAVAEREVVRAQSLQAVVERLSAAGKLRRGVGRQRATETLLLLTSFAVFDELSHRRGLALDEVRRVIRALVERALLTGA